mmetsp:Transcript_22476/g.40511  ORF Transcript_22476/g.40511 Transcript_22476/m.40511 type:complete len:373 (-) Transcript_22476:57-1175(-)
MSRKIVPENSTDQDELNFARYSEPVMNSPTGLDSFDIDTTKINKIKKKRKTAGPTLSIDIDKIGKRRSVIKVEPALQFDIKPRFNSDDLQLILSNRFNQVRSEPIEVLEAQLYKIGKTYNLDFGGADLPIDVLDSMHHIYQLKKMEGQLTGEEIDLLNQNIEDVLDKYPRALMEYKIYSEIVELVSALSIRWRVAHYENYSYRYSSRVSNVKLLSLQNLNEDVYTVEGLWLSVALKYYPLNEVIDDNVIQYAHLLKNTMNEVVQAFVHLNAEADFRHFPTIEGFFAAKFPKLAAARHWEPDYLAKPIDHHELSQPEGFMANCFKTKHQKINQQLKRLIEDLDICYRSFERALISCLLVAKEPEVKSKSLYNL